MIAALLVLSLHEPRFAFAAAFLWLFLAGITSLQFQVRHYFHLEFIPWWAAGFLLYRALTAAAWTFRRSHLKTLFTLLIRPRNWWAAPVKGLTVFTVSSLLLVFVPFFAARLYQSFSVG